MDQTKMNETEREFYRAGLLLRTPKIDNSQDINNDLWQLYIEGISTRHNRITRSLNYKLRTPRRIGILLIASSLIGAFIPDTIPYTMPFLYIAGSSVLLRSSMPNYMLKKVLYKELKNYDNIQIHESPPDRPSGSGLFSNKSK